MTLRKCSRPQKLFSVKISPERAMYTGLTPRLERPIVCDSHFRFSRFLLLAAGAITLTERDEGT